jgi:hypothetical protein
MKELIEKIAAEAGITAEQAQKAATSVSTYLKTKTPHVFHDQLDVIMNGGTMSDGMKKKMGDLKDDLEDAARNFGQKAEELATDVGKKITEVFGKKS